MTKASIPSIAQHSLFDNDAADLLPGLQYETDFLTPQQEAEWLALITALPLAPMRYKQHLAKRRVVSFGGRYDFDDNALLPNPDLPAEWGPLRRKVADWAGIGEADLAHVLVSEYRPGTSLGWHRDVPDFSEIIGVSLLSEAVMRFRPWPVAAPSKQDVRKLVLAPRSVYRMRQQARWNWQHGIEATPALRYSVTFRLRVHDR